MTITIKITRTTGRETWLAKATFRNVPFQFRSHVSEAHAIDELKRRILSDMAADATPVPSTIAFRLHSW